MLGCCCLSGRGIMQSYDMAAWWFRVAAELGNSDAQWMLGCCYLNGQGVNQSLEMAIKW